MTNLRLDEIGFGGLKLLQNPKHFCFGIDAVLLADFARAKKSDRVCELGSGNGAVSFILYSKYEPLSIDGIELQEEACNLARESAKLNGLSEKINFHNADLLNEIFPKESFDLVVSNPPYMEKGSAMLCENSAKTLARHESSALFLDFAREACRLLKPNGRFCLIHRPYRLADIFEGVRAFKLEPKRLQFIAPKKNAASNLFLLECQKGAGKELKMLPELIVRNEDGSFTEKLQKIYNKKGSLL